MLSAFALRSSIVTLRPCLQQRSFSSVTLSRTQVPFQRRSNQFNLSLASSRGLQTSTSEVIPNDDDPAAKVLDTSDVMPSDISEVTAELATNLAAEPTFQSLGLAHYYPSGILQSVLEAVYLNTGLPWWGTIMATTVGLRLCMFPLLVKAQRNMAKMNNHLPETQRLQMLSMKPTHDQALKMQRMEDYAKYMKKHGVHPLINFLPMMCQGTIFASMFFGIRGMTDVPVQSMATGGALWFVDLTNPDPLRLLPVLTCTSLFVYIYTNAEGMNLSTLPPVFRKVMLISPFLSLPVMCYFPAALNVYWMTSNIFTISQAYVIRHPKVRSTLGIPEMIQWKDSDLPMSSFMSEVMTGRRAKTDKSDAIEDILAQKSSSANTSGPQTVDLKDIESRIKELRKKRKP